MKRTTAVVTTIIALLIARPRRAAADPIDDATAVVRDPDARPADKLAAMNRLAEPGVDARRAIPALAAQMDRGLREVRDAALKALWVVAGPSETMRQVRAFPENFDVGDEIRRLASVTGKRSDDGLKPVPAPDPKSRTPGAIAAGLVDPDPKVSALARTLAPKAPPEAFKTALADAVARRVFDAGNTDAVALLGQYGVDATTFARAVERRMALAGDAQRLSLVRALSRLDRAPTVVAALPGLRSQVTRALGRPAEVVEDIAAARRLARGGEAVLMPGSAAVETADELAAAATELLAAPAVRADAVQVLAGAVDQGLQLSPSTIRAFEVDRDELARQLVGRLAVGRLEARLAAARMLAVVGVPADAAQTRAALDRCLRSPDPALRSAAAEAVGTPGARDLARVPELLRDLSADSPDARRVAARQIQSLALDDATPDVTALLVRATDAGDLATREGLRLALEGSFVTARPPKEVLTTLAASSNPDATTRAYARAALRQLPP